MADICYGGGTHGFKAFLFAELYVLNCTVCSQNISCHSPCSQTHYFSQNSFGVLAFREKEGFCPPNIESTGEVRGFGEGFRGAELLPELSPEFHWCGAGSSLFWHSNILTFCTRCPFGSSNGASLAISDD